MAVADLHVHGAPAGQANGPDVSAGRCSPRRQQASTQRVSPDRTHSLPPLRAHAARGGAGTRLPATSMAAGEGYAVTDAAAVSEDMMQSPDQLVAEAEANSLDLGG